MVIGYHAMLKKILNRHEKVTHRRLRTVCEKWGAAVYPKVRLADVFPIEGSGLRASAFRFALQSHFDFLIADDKEMPFFAVEFDGDRHTTEPQRTRDRQKDDLCEHFSLPLLRIDSRYLLKKYRNMDLLSWFVEVWFLSRTFDEEQEKGRIPYDEVFAAFSILSLPDRTESFPLWLSLDIRSEIERLCKAGRCADRFRGVGGCSLP